MKSDGQLNFNFGFHSYCMISIHYHNASSVNTTVKSCGKNALLIYVARGSARSNTILSPDSDSFSARAIKAIAHVWLAILWEIRIPIILT